MKKVKEYWLSFVQFLWVVGRRRYLNIGFKSGTVVSVPCHLDSDKIGYWKISKGSSFESVELAGWYYEYFGYDLSEVEFILVGKKLTR